MISLSPLPTSHPKTFQRLPVRSSSWFYPTFNLLKGRSLGFASAPTNYRALLRLAFATATCIFTLNLASKLQLVGSLCKRHAVTAFRQLRPLVSARFQVYFTPLLTVLFTFPSQYWFTIGLSVVFSLAGWCRLIQTGFLRSRLTQDTATVVIVTSTGLSPCFVGLPRPFYFRLTPDLAVLQPRITLLYGLGCSAFARHYLRNHYLFSFPPPT